MSNYFMSILEDKPSRSFKELLDEQMDQKKNWEKSESELAIAKENN